MLLFLRHLTPIIDSERCLDFQPAVSILFTFTQEYPDILSQLRGGAHVFIVVLFESGRKLMVSGSYQSLCRVHAYF